MPIPAGVTLAVTDTAQGWIEATRRHLMSGRQEERNSLLTAYTPGSGTLALSAPLGGIVAGSRVTVGLNVFYVLSASDAGLTATVIGGQEGSADQSALAGATVRVAPRFTDFEILDALRADLADLSSPENGLFQVKAVDLTWSSGTTGYDLAGVTDLIEVQAVLAQESGSARGWTRVQKSLYRLDRGALASMFPSGLGLQLYGPAYLGLPIRVLYRAGFTAPGAPTFALSDSGLPVTAYDLPPLGAAMRLVMPREIKRSFTEAQSDTRRASEVSAGAVSASYRPLAALRASRIMAEAARLFAAWPDSRF